MWQQNTVYLQRKFIFKNFVQAFSFMTEVAAASEEQNHHPEWSNVYNIVDIRLTTHDGGPAITEKDIRLSQIINIIYEKYSDNGGER